MIVCHQCDVDVCVSWFCIAHENGFCPQKSGPEEVLLREGQWSLAHTVVWRYIDVFIVFCVAHENGFVHRKPSKI